MLPAESVAVTVSHLPASPVGSVAVKRRPPGVAVPTNVSPSPKPEESGASLMKNSNVIDLRVREQDHAGDGRGGPVVCEAIPTTVGRNPATSRDRAPARTHTPRGRRPWPTTSGRCR